jgi:hypothetical protein
MLRLVYYYYISASVALQLGANAAPRLVTMAILTGSHLKSFSHRWNLSERATIKPAAKQTTKTIANE